jgi:hypothetical protein
MKRRNRKGNLVVGVTLDMVFWTAIALMMINLAA